MRSLNTSLPTSRPSRSQAPELLQAFRCAALSVTNLYKTTVTEHGNTRHLGYQDALEDLLSFLDREGLGLQDGQGRKIRQWATERFEGSETTGNSLESDEDRIDTEKRARSSSPIPPTRANHDAVEMADRSNSEDTVSRTESAPPSTKEENQSAATDRAPMFTFSATQPVPNRDVAMHVSEPFSGDRQSSSDPPSDPPTSQSTGPVRVEVLNRNARMQNRHASTRPHTRSSNRDIGLAGGTKRKFHLPEFFDISNLGNSRDSMNGGGKRGRHI